MSRAFYLANIDALKDSLVPCAAEKVDLATSNSSQRITEHLILQVRHVDSRGVSRTMKLRFGLLEGLRFDVVIGLYAISLNFMEVMQDLLTIQLEHQELEPTLLPCYTEVRHNFSCSPLMTMLQDQPEEQDWRDINFAA
jgi:hypothetical protein